MTVPPPKRTIAQCDAIMTAPGALFEMQEVEINGLKQRVFKNTPPSVRDFWLNTTPQFGPRDYLVYEGQRWTYAQSYDRVLEIANLLVHEYGVKKGDRVAIAARNCPEWVHVFFAIEVIGAVIVSVNAWVTAAIMEHCVASTDCKVVFVDHDRAKVLKPSLDRLRKTGLTHTVVFSGEKEGLFPGMVDYDKELLKVNGRKDVPEVQVFPEDIATLFFTSGTTGVPKGVVGTNRQILTNILNSITPAIRAILRRGELPPAPNPNDMQKCFLIGVPLFHATGCHGQLMTGTATGAKIVMMYKWDTVKAADLIINEKVTGTGGLPYMAMEIVRSHLKGKEHHIESLSYGGGPSSPELPHEIVSNLKTTLPGQGYGATELHCAAVNFVGEDYQRRPLSTGLPCLVNDVKIVGENGETLPPMQKGELYVKGCNRANGYWKNPKATAEVFLSDGYYKTGDLAYLDEEGFVYIAGRSKDIIIRGGENISAMAVEDVLYLDSRVKDAAAVALPHPLLGEVVGTLVVVQPSDMAQVKEEDIIALVRAKLPRHMVPVMVDIRCEDFPRNGVGKTMKDVLKKELSVKWAKRQAASAGTSSGHKDASGELRAKL